MNDARTDYAEHRVDLRESRIRKLLRLLESEPRGGLLDVGCAGGELAALLAARGWRVQGAEAEPALLGAARARGIEARAVDLDGAALPWPDGAFDAVVAAEVIEHVVDTDHLLTEIARVLRPAGLAILDSGPDGTTAEELFALAKPRGLTMLNRARSCVFDRFEQIAFRKNA